MLGCLLQPLHYESLSAVAETLSGIMIKSQAHLMTILAALGASIVIVVPNGRTQMFPSLPFFLLRVLAPPAFLTAIMAESRRSRDIGLWNSTATSILFHTAIPAKWVVRMEVQSPRKLQRMVKNTNLRLECSWHIM